MNRKQMVAEMLPFFFAQRTMGMKLPGPEGDKAAAFGAESVRKARTFLADGKPCGVGRFRGAFVGRKTFQILFDFTPDRFGRDAFEQAFAAKWFLGAHGRPLLPRALTRRLWYRVALDRAKSTGFIIMEHAEKYKQKQVEIKVK